MPFQIQEIIELLGYKRSRNDLRHAIWSLWKLLGPQAPKCHPKNYSLKALTIAHRRAETGARLPYPRLAKFHRSYSGTPIHAHAFA